MTTTLQLGSGRTLRLGTSDRDTVAESGELPHDQDSIASRAAAAMLEPLGLPPLETCVLPDDRFAIALAPGTPCVAELVAGILTALVGLGLKRNQIVIVAADASDTQHLLLTLPEEAAAGVRFETHDPTDDGNLCFAGATHAERPLMFNRSLVESEVVLPVSCARPDPGGVFAGLFPTFSDKLSQQRLLASPPSSRVNERFVSEADEAGWMLGVTMAMQIFPSLTGEAASVVVGLSERVSEEVGKLSQQKWRKEVARPADLVIATVTGDQRQQTWVNVGKALTSAARVAAPGAAVALCTELTEELPDPVAELLSRGDYDLLWQEIDREGTPEALALGQLIGAIERGPVYLMSELNPDWVEDIGLAPIGGEAELQRLVKSRPNFAVVEGAQHVSVELANNQDSQ